VIRNVLHVKIIYSINRISTGVWFSALTDLLGPEVSVIDDTVGAITGISARSTCETPVVPYQRPASRHHLPGPGSLWRSVTASSAFWHKLSSVMHQTGDLDVIFGSYAYV